MPGRFDHVLDIDLMTFRVHGFELVFGVTHACVCDNDASIMFHYEYACATPPTTSKPCP